MKRDGWEPPKIKEIIELAKIYKSCCLEFMRQTGGHPGDCPIAYDH